MRLGTFINQIKEARQNGFVENPTAQQLLGMVNRYDDEPLRGLIVGKNVFWWSNDVLDLIHEEFHKKLVRSGMDDGVPWSRCVRLFAERSAGQDWHEYGDWQHVGPLAFVTWVNYRTSETVPVTEFPQLGPVLRGLARSRIPSQNAIKESIPRTLYHGTLRKFVPSIQRVGLMPSAGEFTQSAYEAEPDELAELVFAADKEGLGKTISAMGSWIRIEHPDVSNPYSMEAIERYGALCVLRHGEEDFDQRKDDGDRDGPEGYPQVEPKDYYREYGLKVDYILTGKRLVQFLFRNRQNLRGTRFPTKRVTEAHLPESVEDLKTQPGVVWHGSPSGDLRGGASGLHVGTYEAAKQALEARIGIPAEGEWDGTREYGRTLLMGKRRMKELGIWPTGYNCEALDDDYLPGTPRKNSRGGMVEPSTYADGSVMPLTVRPNIQPFRIVGRMNNSPQNPYRDFHANGYMKGALKRGSAKNGYYYRNEAEDSGSISAVVPNGSHLEPVRVKPVTEGVEEINGVRTYVNPSYEQIMALIRKSPHGALRGLVHGSDVYVWDAYDNHHAGMYTIITGQPTDAGEHADASFVIAHADTKEEEIKRDWINDGPVWEIGPALYLSANAEAERNPRIQSWMRGAQKIQESRILVNDAVECLENPSAGELVGFLQRQKSKECRGYISTTGSVFVWNAAQRIHADMVEDLIGDGILTSEEFAQRFNLIGYRLMFGLKPEIDSEPGWNNMLVDYGPVWLAGWSPKGSEGGPVNPEQIGRESQSFGYLLRGLSRMPRPEPEKPKWTPADEHLLAQLRAGLREANQSYGREWDRFWVNALTGESIPVPDRFDHDGLVSEEPDWFGEPQYDWDMTDEERDEALTRIYERGWCAVLYDPKMRTVNCRVSNERALLVLLRGLTERVDVQQVVVDIADQSFTMTPEQTEQFLKRGRLPRSIRPIARS